MLRLENVGSYRRTEEKDVLEVLAKRKGCKYDLKLEKEEKERKDKDSKHGAQ